MTRFLWALGYAMLFAGTLGAGGRHLGPGWELSALVVTLGYPLMVIVGLAHAVGTRMARGASALAPLLALLAGLPGIPLMRAVDGALHDRRFAHVLPQVQALISGAELGVGDRIRIPTESLPSEIRACCARLVVARRDSLGHVSATVFGQRNVAYLYDPSGERLARGLRLGRWRSHEVLAPNWYLVTRSQ